MDGNRAGRIFGGLVLIGLGVLFLLLQVFDFEFWSIGWPFIIILAGLLFFLLMVLGGRRAGGLAIPGSVVTTVGLILFFQNSTDNFQTWAYAWTLITVAVGVGRMIQGAWTNESRTVTEGRRVVGVGLVLFLLGFAFFELLLNLSGFGFGGIGGYVWPVLLILIGLYLVLSRGRRVLER